jgi:hypothetical protein
MANAATVNLVLQNSGETSHAIWKLTRTMLAAGWKYMSGGNGQSSGCTNILQSGAAGTVTAFSSPTVTLGGLTNMTPGCVGQYITISGGSHGGNDGTFLITSYVSATSVTIYNTSGVSTDSGLTWALLRNSALDLWGVGGAVHLSNVSGGGASSGAAVIGAASGSTGQATITGVSGFTVNGSPGRYATITGSISNNNGSFRIVSATSSQVIVYAPQLVAESGNTSLTITEQYGGNDGSIGAFSTVTSGTSTLINFTTSTFAGFTAADVGRRITILNPSSLAGGNNGTFLIAGYVSASNVLLYNPGGVASDGNNPNLQWVETDPLQHIYPSYLQGSGGGGQWICLQGPTTMKIPIGTNVSTGTFIRGENVTQSSTGAQGELLGYMPDSSGGTGFLVIAPRVVGTGSSGWAGNLYGWNNSTTDTVTGSFSAATVTSTAGPPIAYVREMVWWRLNATQGHIYYQCIDQSTSTEGATTTSTGRFSTMANALSQVSSTVCPGGSTGNPTANGFPLGPGGLATATMAVIGTGGAGSVGTSASYWCSNLNPTNPGRAQLLCANNIEQQGVSQDGTWGYYQSCQSTGYVGIGFQRLDNTEDGDLDPYAAQTFGGYTLSGFNRTQNLSVNSSAIDSYNLGQTCFTNGSYNGVWRCFRRRGLNNPYGVNGNPVFGDYMVAMSTAYLYDYAVGSLCQVNWGYPDQLATTPTLTYVREPVWIWMGGVAGWPRARKGTPRWLMITQGLQVNQTLDSLKWIVLSSGTSPNATFCAGPWDGASTPTF